MPDICDLILDQHHEFRVRFAELDGLRGRGAGADALAAVWGPLADLLEAHASAEEQIFYPRLLELGDEPVEETDDALGDHDDITESVERSHGLDVGSDAWWDAVDAARDENSDHTAEEERGALADFRRNAPAELRDELGGAWLRFHQEHGSVDRETEDVVDFVEEHGDAEQVAAARDMADQG